MEAEGMILPKAVCQWRAGEGDPEPAPKYGKRVILASHLARGLGLPPSDFFCEVLNEYGLQPHNLTPNIVLYIAGFEALFEGYLGIAPRMDFFKYYFYIKRQTVGEGWIALSL